MDSLERQAPETRGHMEASTVNLEVQVRGPSCQLKEEKGQGDLAEAQSPECPWIVRWYHSSMQVKSNARELLHFTHSPSGHSGEERTPEALAGGFRMEVSI